MYEQKKNVNTPPFLFYPSSYNELFKILKIWGQERVKLPEPYPLNTTLRGDNKIVLLTCGQNKILLLTGVLDPQHTALQRVAEVIRHKTNSATDSTIKEPFGTNFNFDYNIVKNVIMQYVINTSNRVLKDPLPSLPTFGPTD